MSNSTTSGVEPSDVLGGAMFAVGAAILLLNLGNASWVIEPTTLSVILMILGIGGVFGRETFVELVKEFVLSKDKKDGDSESDDETGGSGGDGSSDGDDDESDDGEVGIDRPPGDEVAASK